MAQKAALEKQYSEQGKEVTISIDEVNFRLDIKEVAVVKETTQTLTKAEAGQTTQK